MRIQIGIRLEQEIIDAIDSLSAKELRTRSNLIEYILKQYAEARGFSFRSLNTPDPKEPD